MKECEWIIYENGIALPVLGCNNYAQISHKLSNSTQTLHND